MDGGAYAGGLAALGSADTCVVAWAGAGGTVTSKAPGGGD